MGRRPSMLRNDREQNHIKYSIKTTKTEKEWETKIGTNNKGNKQETVTNMVDTNQNISIITLKVSGLNEPMDKGLISKIYKQLIQLNIK